MPMAETMKPPPKHSAATNIDLRGPDALHPAPEQRPRTRPRMAMAMENIQPISFKFQSPGAECVDAR